MDCQLFAQIAALILEGKIDSKSGFELFMGHFVPYYSKHFFATELAYLFPSNQQVYEFFSTEGLIFDAKGMWLLKDGIKWMGLTKKGVISQSEEEWKRYLKEELAVAASDMKDSPNPIHSSLAKLLNLYLISGMLDKWTLQSSSN